MDRWLLVYDTFSPEEQGRREALCTLGNGYFCTRGAAPESSADDVHYPGTYLAGGYNRLRTEIADHTVENEDLVNLPNWLSLSFRIDGEDWFDLRAVEILAFRQELDMHQGLLRREIRFRDRRGRTSLLKERRLAHMRERHLAALEISLHSEDWSGEVEFRSALDARVVNANVERYRNLANRHLRTLETREGGESLFLKVETLQSELRIAMAARTRAFDPEENLSPELRLDRREDYIAQHFTLSLAEGSSVRVEKVLALYNSRDEASAECGLEACKAAARAPGFDELFRSQREIWARLWRRFGMTIEDEEDGKTRKTLMILNLHIFHMLQTVSLHAMDLDIGVPARGWHGEAYRGHVFWDELFIFPLLNLRVPEITRTLLRYRFRRLGEARKAAREAGYRGAMYPWQSGSNGREESQKLHLNPRSGRWIPDNSRLQRHVNAAIAWNVWQYYQVTGDMEFLSFFGAEMILEIARFWASIASWSPKHDRYEILGVMGPDEYHDAYPGSGKPGLDNNAYTNIMAVWVLACALEILRVLPEDRGRELREAIALEQEEIDRWEEISRRMRIVFHGKGIISQFEGYDRLEELDWETYRGKYGDVMRLDRILEAEGDTPNRYRCSKQADVLMLFYLFSADELREIFDRLGYPFGGEMIPENIAYYIERTAHGSTLSQVVHSWVLSRSDREGSWRLFNLALRSDIDDIQGGTTSEGIHLGAMAGTVDLIQRGFTGIETRGDLLRLNPRLPRELAHLCLRIRYRGQSLELEITRDRMKVTCLECGLQPVRIGFGEKERKLKGGETHTFRL